MNKLNFPVEEKLEEIKSALADNKSLVLTAPPGSGKTTCVPAALLNEPWLEGKKIIMLEPRRLAARSSASYIASKLGTPVGGLVGYQVRLERKISSSTRLEILTEGLLTQRLISDPELSDVGLVIFDEFHERSLACDLSFSLALEVRRALRPDLRLMVMSATLDADEVSDHLRDAEVVRAEGRMFPVETRYLGDMSVPGAVSRAIKETDGDILVFLPGEGEIRRAAESLDYLSDIDILPLYGSLPKEEQDRVFEPSCRRKVILATSIAETSLTIPGIVCVIDSGLMRVPRFSPGTGMTELVTLPLSLDRAEQRRGRAGRVQAGVCYRLWEEGAEAARPAKMTPEILDADLCSLVLTSVSWGAVSRGDLPWLTPPAASAWEQATGLLKQLGALNDSGRLTEKGERMSRMPMHPRLANMLLGSRSTDVALLAAIIEEGVKTRETDIRKILDEIRELPNRPFARRAIQLSKRFERFVSDSSRTAKRMSEGASLALAYPDRVAKNRGNGSFVMVSGRGATLESSDPLAKAEFIVCCELDDRLGNAKIFLASPVGREEVEEMFADFITEKEVCEWDRRTDSVKAVARRMLGSVSLNEKPLKKVGSEEAVRAVIDGIRFKGVENMPCWTKESMQLKERVNFVFRHVYENDSTWPELTDETILRGLEGFVGAVSKWKDLEKIDLFAVIDFILLESGHDRRELDRLAPQRLEVPSGSHMLVHYEGDEPAVEVRLQECFGLLETPKVLGGRVPVVMTLLSPAQRPIQITKDLAYFWKEGYPLVRKDMRGRYPKHYWPEDPFTAVATRRVRPDR